MFKYSCPNCNVEHTSITKPTKKFCNKSCAASYNNSKRIVSDSTKEKTSKSLSGRKRPTTDTFINGSKSCNLYPTTCMICHKFQLVSWRFKNHKTCRSLECKAKASINKTSKIGSTNSIEWNHPTQGLLRFDSSWEKSLAEFLDSHNILWIRPTIPLEWVDSNNTKRYFFPDFYLLEYNIYLDPKNIQVIKKDKEKLDFFKNRITLFYGTVSDIIDQLNPFLRQAH